MNKDWRDNKRPDHIESCSKGFEFKPSCDREPLEDFFFFFFSRE